MKNFNYTKQTAENTLLSCMSNPTRWIEAEIILKLFPELKYIKNKNNLYETPIHWASVTDITNLINLAITNTDLSIADTRNNTPIDWAMEKYFFIKTDTLNELNLEPSLIPLILSKQEEILIYLLSLNPDLNKTNLKLNHILEMAVKANFLNITKTLYDKAYITNNLNLTYENNNTLCHYLTISLFNNNEDIAIIELNNAIELYNNCGFFEYLNQPNSFMQTPLHSACIRYISEDRPSLVMKEMIKFLILSGLNLHGVDKKNNTPMDILKAAPTEYLKFIKDII